MSLLYTPLVDNSHRRFVPEGLSTLLEDGKFNVERARLLNKVRVASPPFPRTNRTSLVPPLVLSGHAASLTPPPPPLGVAAQALLSLRGCRCVIATCIVLLPLVL